MVTERLNIRLGEKGGEKQSITVEINYNIVPYKNNVVMKALNVPDDRIQWFAEWKKADRCTVLDVNAPRWYIRLVSLCNAICEGGERKSLLGHQLSPIGTADRRIEVEGFITDIAGNYRDAYIAARKSMYQTLLDIGLYSSSTKDITRDALEYLEALSSTPSH